MTLLKTIGAISVVICVGWTFYAAGRAMRTHHKLRACPGAIRCYWAFHAANEREQVEKIRARYSVSAASRYVKGAPGWNEGAHRQSRRRAF